MIFYRYKLSHIVRLFFGLFTLIIFYSGSGCAGYTPLQPPELDYSIITRNFQKSSPGGHLPLTIQRGINHNPSLHNNRFLFYASDVNGSSDIWMRDVKNTINVVLVEHPSDQSQPVISPDGKFLTFISKDEDINGDIRIVRLNTEPNGIVQQALEGLIIDNLWVSSKSLSRQIENSINKANTECPGPASESDPIWSADGKSIYFSSDRCTPGLPNIWKVAIQDGKIITPPVRLTQSGGLQPTIDKSGQKLAYLTYSNGSGQIRMMNPQTGDSSSLIEYKKSILMHPSLDETGDYLYYSLIEDDTNGNGFLDTDDDASINKYAMSTGRSERILEDDSPLYGVIHTGFNGGSVLYAAGLHDSVNIYMIPDEGIIPRMKTLHEQFMIATDYSNTSQKRYILALEAIFRFFGDSINIFAYRGETYAKIITSYGTNSEERKKILYQLKNALTGDPYSFLKFTLILDNAPPSIRSQKYLRLLREIEPDIEKIYGAASKSVISSLLHDTAINFSKSGQNQKALEIIHRLNTEYPNYHRSSDSRFLEGSISLKYKNKIPDIFSQLLHSADLSFAMREKIINEIITHVENATPAIRLKFISSEGKNKKHHPLIKSTLDFIECTIKFDRGDLKGAENQARKIVHKVPLNSGVYIRSYRLIAEINDRLGNYQKAYDARLEYGGRYRPETGVKISAAEYRDIIEDSERYIESYLRSARSISSLIESQSFSILSNIEQSVTRQDILVTFNNTDRDLLQNFCKPESRAGNLISRTGQPAYIRARDELCSNNRAYINGNTNQGLKVEDARTASDLMYLTSYINANLLNIMFLHIKITGQFPDLYRERAIAYHRLKVDIAMERNRKSLSWKRLKSRLFNPEDIQKLFVAQDPFDETTFNELAHGYKLATSEAMTHGDYSLIYGYAYTLIHKSIERELFYDSLLESGIKFDRGTLIDKKETILKDLKNAEYRLMSILYIQPDYPDAYLLLGWMNEYIDERRSKTITTDPSILSQSLDLLLQTRTAKPRDGVYYNEVYRIYFPPGLYETNIELYRQALRILGKSKASDSELAAINLNLANNYFKLMNFKKAVEHYELTARYSQSGKDNFLSGYRGKAHYHFNYGRALFYSNQSIPATIELQKAYDIYKEYEDKKIQEDYSTAVFLRNIKDDKEDQLMSFIPIESSKNGLLPEVRNLQNIRYKLSLISSLIGLAYWDAGEYSLAIEAYKNADSMLYEQQNPPGDAVERANLMNFMALAYQEKEDFHYSDRSANFAENLALEKGIGRFDRRFQPETTGGRLLGCVLDYGEDFSIIGEGRNPYGFSPLRQFELSLGIQLENALSRGDFDEALSLLQKRRSVFLKSDGDVLLGKIGAVISYNNEAYNYYKAKKYLKSSELFLEAAEEAASYNDLFYYRNNILSHFQSIFAHIESSNGARDDSIELLEDSLDILKDFRKEYRKVAKNQFIKKKNTEMPDYNFKENRDDPIVDNLVNRELADMVAVEGILNFYIGYVLDKHATNRFDINRANEYYIQASALIRKAADSLDPRDPENIIRILRFRINNAVILHAAGKLLEARKELLNISDLAFEYNLTMEQWYTRYLLANLEIQISNQFDTSHTIVDIGETLDEAIELLTGNPELFSDYERHAYSLFNLAADYFASHGYSEKSFLILEKKWYFHLQREFQVYPINPENPDLKQHLSDYRNTIKNLRNLHFAESIARIEHNTIDRITKEREHITVELNAFRKRIISSNPKLKPFFQYPDGVQLNRPGNKSTIIRTFRHNNRLHVWIHTASGTDYKLFDFFNTMKTNGLATYLSASKRLSANSGHIFIISDSGSFQLPVDRIIRDIAPDSPPPVYITRVQSPVSSFITNERQLPDSLRGTNLFNVSNVKSGPVTSLDLSDTDIIIAGDDSDYSLIDTLRFFRKWPERKRFLSMALLPINDKDNRWNDYGLIFEYLSASATGTLALVPPSIRENIGEKLRKHAGKAPYSSTGMRIFGFDGFEAKNLERALLDKYNISMELGDKYAYSKKISEAQIQYTLASSYVSTLDRLNHLRDIALIKKSILNIKPGSESPDFDFSLFKRLVNTYFEKGNTKIALSLIENLSRNLHINGYAENAEEIIDFYMSQQPAYSPKLSQMRDYHLLLSQIIGVDKNNFPNQFHEKLLLHRRRILEDPQRDTILNRLFDMTAYDELLELTGSRNANKSNGSTNWDMIAAVDAYLIHGYSVYEYSVSQGKKDTALAIAYSLKGQREHFKTTMSQIIEEEKKQSSRIRRSILSAWEKRTKGMYYSIQDPGLVPGGNSTDLFQSLSSIEKSVVFRLLVDSIKFDARLQAARYLESLINIAAKETSISRANIYALETTYAYIEHEDFDTAARFFQMHLDMLKGKKDGIQAGVMESFHGLLLFRMGKIQIENSLAENWIQTLIKHGHKESAAAINGIKQKPTLTWFIEYLHALKLFERKIEKPLIKGRDGQLTYLLSALKTKAMENGQYRIAFNISVMLENYKVFEHARKEKHQIRKSGLEYVDYIEKIRNHTPEHQKAVGIVDTAEQAIRVGIEKEKVYFDRMDHNGRFLRGRLHEMVYKLRFHEGLETVFNDLALTYRSLFGMEKTTITYAILPGIHGIAPLQPLRTDRIYYVYDLGNFLGNRAIAESRLFTGKFRVYVHGSQSEKAKTIDPDYDSIPANRLYKMEISSIRRTSPGIGNFPSHIIQPISDLETKQLNNLSKVLKSPSSWFFSGNNIIDSDTGDPVKDILFLNKFVGYHSSVPGILTLKRTEGIHHPLFVKYYYDRNIPAVKTGRRYIYAYLRLMQNTNNPSELYGYRLVTPVPLTE